MLRNRERQTYLPRCRRGAPTLRLYLYLCLCLYLYLYLYLCRHRRCGRRSLLPCRRRASSSLRYAQNNCGMPRYFRK